MTSTNAELRDAILLLLPIVEMYAQSDPVAIRRASDARALVANLEARSLQPEGKALTEQEIAKIEAELIGPGRAYGFVHITYCHVCGNNVEYGHMDDCPWAKIKALLSPQGTIKEKR